jgi:general secretion pathway protein D
VSSPLLLVLDNQTAALQVGNEVLNSPTFEQRRVESTIAVQDGEAIAIGGLIRDRDEQTDSGVPLLKDIPLLGFLFGTTNNQNTRTELLILLTPRVVGGQEEAQRLTNEIRRRLHGVTELEERVR